MTAPNIPGCTCDRDDTSWVGEDVPMPLCSRHDWLRKLSWESLACIAIDYEAALVAAESAAVVAPKRAGRGAG